MTYPFDEYGDRLRRALHAEADAVMPAPDGLDRIRTGIDNRRGLRWAGLPWFRPLTAVGAALAAATIAIAAPPVITNIIASPAGHEQPGDGQGLPARPSGQFPGSASTPDASPTGGEPSLSASPTVTSVTSPTATTSCRRPGAGSPEPSSADPSSQPTPDPRPSDRCDETPSPAPSSNPRPPGSVEPTPPSTEGSQHSAPAAPEHQSVP